MISVLPISSDASEPLIIKGKGAKRVRDLEYFREDNSSTLNSIPKSFLEELFVSTTLDTSNESIIEKLQQDKCYLIKNRTRLLDSFFYIINPISKSKLKKIESEIDKIESKIYSLEEKNYPSKETLDMMLAKSRRALDKYKSLVSNQLD